MKRVLSMILIAALLLTVMMVGVVSASAQAFDTAIVIGNTTYVADIGETFTYTVKVTSAKAVSAGQVEIPVDFTYLSGDAQDDLYAEIDDIAPVIHDTAQIFRFDEASASGLTGYVVNFASDSDYDFTGGKALITLKFTVLKAGTIHMNPTFREFLDDNSGELVSVDGAVIDAGFSTSVAVDLPKNNSNAFKTPRISSITSVSNGLRIEWNAIEGAPKYRLLRNNGSWVNIADLTGTSYVDTNVVSGESYLYTVRVINENGDSRSNFVNCGWSATYIAQPAITSFESVNAGLTMRWAAVNGSPGYRIYRKSGGGWIGIGDVNGCTFTDAGVVPGTSYTYTICCLDRKGREISSHSNTGFTSYYLGAPVLTGVSNGNGIVTVTWNKMNGAARYRVFRKNVDENTGWFDIGDTTELSFNDKVVTSGKTYTYTVRCVTANGSAYASPFDSTGLTITYIAQPSITKLTSVNGGVSITIGKVNGAAKYRIYKKNSKGWAKLVDTASLTYTDKSVKAGTAYYYSVRCLNADSSAFTSSYNTTGWKITYIAPPTPKTVANVYGGVKFTWAKSAGAAKYRVYRRVGKGSWVNLGYTANLYWVDKKAASGTTYTYTVCAVNAAGKVVTSGYNATGKSIKYIAAPGLKSVAKSGKTVKFVWTKPKGAVKFRVYRKTGKGKWVNLGYTAATSWTDKSVKSGYKYTYTVCCVSANGKVVQSAYNPTGKAITYR